MNLVPYKAFVQCPRYDKILRKRGTTKDMNFQEMCCISHNRTRVDSTSAETQTYFDGNSDGIVNILTGIESPWFYTGLMMGDYAPRDHHDRTVTGELYLRC